MLTTLSTGGSPLVTNITRSNPIGWHVCTSVWSAPLPALQSYRHTTFLSGVISARYAMRVNRTLPFDSIHTSSYSGPFPVE